MSDTRRESGIQKIRVPRSAAMMDEAHNGLDSKKAEAMQTLIVPAPVGGKRVIRCDGFPQHWISYCLYPQPGDSIQVARTAFVPRLCDLVSIRVAEPDKRAFQAAPKFEVGNEI